MNWKNLHGLIDISPFLLYESMGDSEKDSDLNMSSFDDNNTELTHAHDVDDAQSCCSDSSEIYNNDRSESLKENLNSKKSDQQRMHGDHEYNPNYREINDDDDEEDDGAINQYCGISKKGFVFSRSQKKNKGCVGSKMEPMKKEEKDKLFWDTCLAS